MVPPFEIFRLEESGPIWCASVPTLEAAKAEVRLRVASTSGTYMVLSLKTRNRIVLGPDGTSEVTHLED
jgi:hypothetical protein